MNVEITNGVPMNFILTEAFSDDCEVVFNTNLDDIYRHDRFQIQLKYTDEFDIVSSDFCYIEENGEEDNITLYKNILQHGSVVSNLNKDHNVIAHPCVAFTKRFWKDKNNRYDVSQTPHEDRELWKEAISRGYKFLIVPEVLLFYRIHKNQVSHKN